MSVFICDKCRTCGKFPFCTVTESKDGNCGEYIKPKTSREITRLNSDGKEV